jgi:tRNA (guanosine-2'-O-)-methyltransferase
MRRTHPEAIELPLPTALPAPAAEVVRILEPLLTEQRLARIDQTLDQRTRSVVPVLDGLLDPHNIAAVLRSADAFGTQEVHVVEGSEPFMASQRVTQGTDRWLDVVRHRDAAACVAQLRGRGYRVYVAEMDGHLQPEDLAREPRIAVIFGNEHLGIAPATRALADDSYAIPMRGFVESLNVSVAAALTLYAATRGRGGDLGGTDRLALKARFLMQSVERAEEVVLEQLRRSRG